MNYKSERLVNGDTLAPIFINGQFRTRTTWWFTQFRKLSQCMCFYTPLTPILVDHTPLEASVLFQGSKCLRHEETYDYYQEYPGYPNKMVKTARDWSTHSYFMDPDSEDIEMERHFQYLIDYAQKRGKIPVFKLNWGLMRGTWLKSHFGGTHLYITRDPLSLRRSFDSFRGSLSWAWRDLIMIVGQNQDHPLMRPVTKMLKYRQPEGVLDYKEARHYASQFCRSGKLNFTQEMKLKLITYFQKLGDSDAKYYADYSIGDINNVKKVERDIRALTNLPIDLSNYKTKKIAKKDDPVHVSPKH